MAITAHMLEPSRDQFFKELNWCLTRRLSPHTIRSWPAFPCVGVRFQSNSSIIIVSKYTSSTIGQGVY